MQKYFNIFLEFNHIEFNRIITDAIVNKKKGYVCVVDGNVLAYSFNNNNFRAIINGALVNSCDGSSVAMLAGCIHKQKFTTYTGPEIFSNFIRSGYKQMFLGNTSEVLNLMYNRFHDEAIEVIKMRFNTLPFLPVDEFNYGEIGTMINQFSPQIIWVSLGAPKQEIFVSKLLPYVNEGVLFSVGAAFNLYLGNGKYFRAPEWMRKLHLEWLFRVVREPLRVGKRAWDYALIIPALIISEKKKLRNKNLV